ncbi:MAG: hypothetical protein WEB58_18885 [Planctomycetaceae bacterium]
MVNPHPNLTTEVIHGLGWAYLALFLMNLVWTLRSFKHGGDVRVWDIFGGQVVRRATFWASYTMLLGMFAVAHFVSTSDPEAFLLVMPDFAKNFIDGFADPTIFFALSVLLMTAVIYFRETLVKPAVAWFLLNLMLVFTALSMTDYDFRQIVGKPDNVPIVSMLFIVAFFTWLYFSRAVENDRRTKAGLPLFEQEKNDKILVWPDLVYTELICMIAITVILVVWGVVLQAPLEEPASAAKTPNPSKAPWYFLGLQEMLVYYDPWLAGVVFPSVILGGLMAIPYIDFNKLGNGYYTFKDRAFSVSVFMFGFLPLWVAMIVLGTFLRGPNWNFFGIYEFWDVHKLEVLNNRNLSQYFWEDLLHRGLPTIADVPQFIKTYTPALITPLVIIVREWLGIVLTLFYLGAAPMLLVLIPKFKEFFFRMGFIRYMVFANLLLMMLALPLKMVLRWTISLKYIVAIPEWFFNI